MLCHKRMKKALKVFFEAVLEQLTGLKLYVKVIGANGEKRLIHATCDSSPTAALLLCFVFFFYQGFHSQTLTTHRTAGEGRGPSYSTLQLPPAHEHSDIYLQLCT